MSLKELGEYTRISKYAQFNKEKGRRETWREQVDRVMNQHKTYFTSKGVFESIKEEWDEARSALLNKDVLGSQRVLQFGGEGVLRKHARGYNCTSSYCDRPRFFQEAFWLLLCGAGVGFSAQLQHISQLPKIAKRTGPTVIHQVEDTIEGWADAAGVLLSSYFVSNQPFSEFAGCTVLFDFSKVRPEGSPLSWGGKAPGPAGLKLGLELVEKVIEGRLLTSDSLLSSDCVDIFCHLSDAVLSGGVRRSAGLAFFSINDPLAMKFKTGDWFSKNKQRSRVNISIIIDRKTVTKEQFVGIFESTRQFGEPGFYFVDSLDVTTNPCGEIASIPKTRDGRVGWWFCNLSTINMKKVKTLDQYLKAARAAAILGTFQAAYTDFDYLGEVSQTIAREQALLGVSMTGMMDSPEVAFDPVNQATAASLVKKTNREVAAKININSADRSTTLKPEGTGSLPLECSSGIHTAHSKRWIRIIQENIMAPTLHHFSKYNPMAIENSVWGASGTDKAVSFLCEAPRGSLKKSDISAIQLLELVVLTQSYWVNGGADDDKQQHKFLRHSVSNTVDVKDDEWDKVKDFIFDHKNTLSGVTLMPDSGDKDYQQAPFTAVYTAQEISDIYGDCALFASGLITTGLDCFGNNLWNACDTLLGRGEDLTPAEGEHYTKIIKREWRDKVINFANKYLNGDVRKTTYLLKDVYNWKRWCDLKREYKEVPWEDMKEEEYTIKNEAGSACSGTSCDLFRFN